MPTPTIANYGSINIGGELKEALSHMKPGKCPGQDALTVQYYKMFQPTHAQFFMKTLDSLTPQTAFLKQTLEATITVIPKARTLHYAYATDPFRC